ncbi:MAG: hypothetical protein FJ038_00925 [Chloroflexi bacterium]|nr:hypothetical protein [Chloroflexota bacterium]
MDERPELVRLSQGRGAGARLLGVAAASLIGTAIVAAGAFGGSDRDEPRPRPAATVQVSAARDTTHAPAATRHATVTLPHQGYAVTYDGTPMLYDDDALAIYQLGDAVVSVAVGTPANGASLLGQGITARINGRTLDQLTDAYLAAIGTGAESSAAIAVDGEPGLMLRLTPGTGPGYGPGSAAALFLVDRRAFVFWSHLETALRAFLGGLTFGPGLFVSRDLGFQVPLLVDEPPFGATVSNGEGSTSGLWVFPTVID